MTPLEQERSRILEMTAAERLLVLDSLLWFIGQTSEGYVMRGHAIALADMITHADDDDCDLNTDVSVLEFIASVVKDYSELAEICHIARRVADDLYKKIFEEDFEIVCVEIEEHIFEETITLDLSET